MEYSDVWDTKKEALLIVTNFELAVKDINTGSQLVSQNSDNKQFITEIGEIMPQFMDNIKKMMHIAADNCLRYCFILIIYSILYCVLKVFHNYKYQFIIFNRSPSNNYYTTCKQR